MFGAAHDEKMWKSLNREQRAWVAKLLQADQLAVDMREWLACAWAFDQGLHTETVGGFLAKVGRKLFGARPTDPTQPPGTA